MSHTSTWLTTYSPGCRSVSLFLPETECYLILATDHTEEATQYIKEALGEHYLSHEEYWIPNLWRSFMDCQFVEDEGKLVRCY